MLLSPFQWRKVANCDLKIKYNQLILYSSVMWLCYLVFNDWCCELCGRRRNWKRVVVVVVVCVCVRACVRACVCVCVTEGSGYKDWEIV